MYQSATDLSVTLHIDSAPTIDELQAHLSTHLATVTILCSVALARQFAALPWWEPWNPTAVGTETTWYHRFTIGLHELS